LASIRKDEPAPPKLKVMIEAARRANWDALHGPEHLRAGRFRYPSRGHSRGDADSAAQQGVAADGASRRR